MTELSCPFGHAISTDLPPGGEVRCGQCRTETGDVVTVIVPGGTPEPVRQRPARAGTGWAGPCRRCRTWSRCPDGQELPPGWLVITIGTDPATDPAHRTSKTTGPYCGFNCASIALKGPRARPDHLRTLMAEPPAGRDR